jgi:dipeptidyl-peptidase III
MKSFFLQFMAITSFALMLASCGNNAADKKGETTENPDSFAYFSEQFADIKILRYRVPGFEELTTDQKILLYYLSQAALCGRDITWDQNCKYNLTVRKTLEAIVEHYKGNRDTPEFSEFMTYTKRLWVSNGIHHHYSSDKIIPGFTEAYFRELLKDVKTESLPVLAGEPKESFITRIVRIIFDPEVAPRKVSLDNNSDLLASSSVNFYEGVTQKEAEDFYAALKVKGDTTPVSLGLNSKLVKENGKVVEKVWKIGGMYDASILKIVYWLDKAAGVAENDQQKAALQKLIMYYTTGDLKTWDEYNIMWVKDVTSLTDYVNGFIEVYTDPLGMKATWEAVVNFKDKVATARATTISENAQWFEDHSPVDAKYKKKKVKGVSAKVITVVQLGGDCHPTTPIGINLPNANWIRKNYGSKSVTMDNIMYAYDRSAAGSGFLQEFCYSPEEIELAEKFGFLSGNLHTDLHECVGHGSGQMMKGVTGESLKNYHSAIEETRADLFALYYLYDPRLVELGLMPSLDAGKAVYNQYIRNGMMTQLTRIAKGKNIEQAHMRNRQLIAKWVYEKGAADKVIEMKTKDNKTFFVVNDHEKLRYLFGDLLHEVQRITSEGDYKAARDLVENYGVKVDQKLHEEVLERYARLKLAPYAGFINPVLVPVMKDGKIVDVNIEYPDNFTEQMMHYGKHYSFLKAAY